MIYSLIKRLARAVALRLVSLHSWDYFAMLLAFDNGKEVNYRGTWIEILSLNIKLKRGQGVHLLSGYSVARCLQEMADAVFVVSPEGQIIIEIRDLAFEVHTAEELYILREVFVEHCYDFTLPPGPRPLVVVDIGMNVAISACHFARRKDVQAVIGFEPFIPTFQQAKKNIQRNSLEKNVEILNVGLSDKAQSLTTSYSRECCGQVSVFGVDQVRSPLTDLVTETIQLESAGSALDSALSKFPTEEYRYAIKMDCEGSEYKVLPLLSEAVMANTEVIMIEWHEHGPDSLVEVLARRGFATIKSTRPPGRIGLLYGFKSASA